MHNKENMKVVSSYIFNVHKYRSTRRNILMFITNVSIILVNTVTDSILIRQWQMLSNIWIWNVSMFNKNLKQTYEVRKKLD
jgi:hypothetical protein